MLCFFNHFTPVASLAGTRTGMSTGLRGFGRFITVGKSVAHPRENRMLYQIMIKQWYSRLRSFVGWSFFDEGGDTHYCCVLPNNDTAVVQQIAFVRRVVFDWAVIRNIVLFQPFHLSDVTRGRSDRYFAWVRV